MLFQPRFPRAVRAWNARAKPSTSRASTDTITKVGKLTLRSPVMIASGTAGRSDEQREYGSLGDLGAVVVKSLAVEPFDGNPAPRLRPLGVGAAGMINSVGMQGPGLRRWLDAELPPLVDAGVHVVASIWGTTVDGFRQAADMLAEAPPEVIAVEINISCPNTERGLRMFAHCPEDTEAVVEASSGCQRPRWAKLSPNTHDLVEIARAAERGGADAVVLTNTLSGMAIDIERRRPTLGGVRGGVSGAALHPVAVRAIFDVHEACPGLPIVGVGGVASGPDAIEMLMAGASAVQVGTATFADPRAPWRVLTELRDWCQLSGVERIDELVGAAHGRWE